MEPRPKSTYRYRRINAADAIAEELTRRIIAGEIPPSEPLPSIRQLAVDFGVSSLTIREAVKALQVRGLVESRHGSGTYVLPPGSAEESLVPWMIRPVDADEYMELNEAREIVEGQIVVLAASRRTDEDLTALREVLESLRSARTDAKEYLEADIDFHITLAEAARNRILMRMMLAARAPIRRLQAARVADDLAHNGNLDHAVADHVAITDAVERGDPEAAQEALKRITHRAEAYLHTLGGEHDGEAPAGS